MARFFQPKKKSQQVERKHQSVTIERLDHQGAGIAYYEKKPLFVDGALPGESVVVQLTENKSKYARAKLIKVVSPSTQRVEPFCPHYQQCGGCDLQHLEYAAQLQQKQQTLVSLFHKIAGQEESLQPLIRGEQHHYRRRARFSVLQDKKTQRLHIGFRRKQSKQIVDIHACPLLAEPLNPLLVELREVLQTFSAPHKIGHIELVQADNGPCIALRYDGALAVKDKQALLAVAQRANASLYHSPASGEMIRLSGDEPYYQETGLRHYFTPNNFIQVNQNVNVQMVQQALSWLDLNAQDRVLDLFCGLGNFTLPIATKCAHVIGVEGVDAMVKRAQDNARYNQIENAQFYQANLEEALAGQVWAKAQFDKILLDPARAGAGGIVEQFRALGAKRVVYVSCNPATLARDSQSLLAQGYKLEKLAMLDMFPHTGHLESMALFSL